jgi:hypothetical protein
VGNTGALEDERPSVTRIALPPEVTKLYEAVETLSERHPGRPFTLDGHMMGSIGEVVAAEAFNLHLYPPSQAVHDAWDDHGDVQIKITGGKHVSMYACCERLLVLRIVNPQEAEVVYDGCGGSAWEQLAPCRRTVSVASVSRSFAPLPLELRNHDIH